MKSKYKHSLKTCDALRKRCKQHMEENKLSGLKVHELASLEMKAKAFEQFLSGRCKSIKYDDGVRLADMFNSIDSYY